MYVNSLHFFSGQHCKKTHHITSAKSDNRHTHWRRWRAERKRVTYSKDIFILTAVNFWMVIGLLVSQSAVDLKQACSATFISLMDIYKPDLWCLMKQNWLVALQKNPVDRDLIRKLHAEGRGRLCLKPWEFQCIKSLI